MASRATPKQMFKKLDDVEKRFERLGEELQDPALSSNQKQYRALMKEYADLEKVVSVYRAYKRNTQELKDNVSLLETESDEEMRRLVKADILALEKEKEATEEALRLTLLPKDPNDDRNVIIEIRAGAGGDEASLFAEELFRAYTIFAGRLGWKVTVMSVSQGNVGGYKEVVASILGDKVYSLLKYESGVHRVQRVPETETQGRVHTSTVTVAVLPEADEVDVQINPTDLRVDVMRASGAGGQSVNRTESAVRLTHLPTGIAVHCQEGKSQIANKERAMVILYSKLMALEGQLLA